MSATETKTKKPRWIPLESNPDMLNAFAQKIGGSSRFGFADCWSLDEEMLAMIAQPVLGLIFLFPSSAMREAKQAEASKANAEKGENAKNAISENLFFMEQIVGNACGSIAVLHTLINNLDTAPASGAHFWTDLRAKRKQCQAIANVASIWALPMGSTRLASKWQLAPVKLRRRRPMRRLVIILLRLFTWTGASMSSTDARRRRLITARRRRRRF
jgi:Ubiquitin carboxyl-terminal hydrolase, family 1